MTRPTPVPGWVPALPASPGVYTFESRSGATLYVGKTVNLRRRVRGYFYGGGPDDSRLSEMLAIARNVRVEQTGSDLEARLLEAERILGERPPYNKALKGRWRGWYLEARWREPYPRLRIVRRPRGASTRHFGPFWGRQLPERIQRLTEKIFRLRTCTGSIRPLSSASPCIQHDLGLCTAPCAERVTLAAYREQVDSAIRLLSSREFSWTLRERLEHAMESAAARLDFERAAAIQARLNWLDELESARYALDPERVTRSWLIVLPAAAEGDRILIPVARGRVLARRQVEWRPQAWEPAVEDACYAVRVAELRSTDVLEPRESVPSSLVARWMDSGTAEGTVLDLARLDTSGAIDRLHAVGRPVEAITG